MRELRFTDRTKASWLRAWGHELDLEPTEQQKKEAKEIQDRIKQAITDREEAGMCGGDERRARKQLL